MIKTFKLLVISIFILTVFHNSGSAQIRLALGPVLGLTSPTVDYTGETTDFYNGTKYGVRSAINYGIEGKLSLGPLNARLAFTYASLSNTGKGDPNSPGSTLEISHTLSVISIGTELGFGVPLVPVRPYIGLDLLFSSIGGTINFQGTPGVTSDSRSIGSESRTGLGLALGTEVGIGKFELDLSLRYNMYNLFGKSYKVVNNSNRTDVYTSLNDDSDPNFVSGSNSHFVGSSRTIAAVQFQVGILFGF